MHGAWDSPRFFHTPSRSRLGRLSEQTASWARRTIVRPFGKDFANTRTSYFTVHEFSANAASIVWACAIKWMPVAPPRRRPRGSRRATRPPNRFAKGRGGSGYAVSPIRHARTCFHQLPESTDGAKRETSFQGPGKQPEGSRGIGCPGRIISCVTSGFAHADRRPPIRILIPRTLAPSNP